ncbi:substrate of the Dot/Icm secretion system [Legionella gratiana]|uniref:Substrate of the Dot/Icm secretion system n=1 Tax=Legionella gratiana TaxID=45066 RepID=A0A378JEX6_9GAMM|nr:type IV secretion protein Dot [Legionella gratiana]KTD11942.1 substrate of the Dot/Icm secretion system [Legionella gratiana]STX46454.1 substrate of the Dot/Icm secretion system [Legionella gratiana]
MNIEEIMTFIENLYADHTKESIKFKSRAKNQLVSPTMSKSNAQELCKILKNILPEQARLQVHKSKEVAGEFCVVLSNPQEVFSIYAKHAAEQLNRYKPLPKLSAEEEYYTWEYNPSSMLIEYRVSFSIPEDLDTEKEVIGSDEKARQLKAIIQYTKRLQSIYPELKILGTNDEDGGADKFFLTFNYKNYKVISSLNNPASLRQIAIGFFRAHPEHYITEISKILPKEITDELTDIKPRTPDS